MPKGEKGFVLLTVLIVVFVLSTLGLMRIMLSASRIEEIAGNTSDLQLLYIAESGISRAQSKAHDPGAFMAILGNEYFSGKGSYEIEGDISGLIKTVTVNSYMPNKAEKKYEKIIVIQGESITSNYLWREGR
ncbi:MAG: hypothetical protein KKA19_08125 [Candidatus Margulisbacteria bacterium]|nr:hypothetical protein [Candidatus Margulisiibacteriota bacterium]